MRLDEVHDGFDQLRHALERAATNPFVRDLSEPALDQVEPGTARGNEVKVKSLPSSQPARNPLVFVGAVVVNDEMDIQFLVCLLIDLVEELEEFLMPVARQALGDNVAIQHVQRTEQRGGPVTLVIVRQGPCASRKHGEARLCPIQGLDLAFLVHAKHQRSVRGVHVESHHIHELLDELGVVAQLERPHQVWFEIMRRPDALNRHAADALRFGHGTNAPVRSLPRSGLQGGLDHAAHLGCRKLGLAARPPRVLFDTRDSLGSEPITPQLHCRTRKAKLRRNDLALFAIGGHQDDLGALDEPLRQTSSSRVLHKLLTRLRREADGSCCSHKQHDTISHLICQETCGTLH